MSKEFDDLRRRVYGSANPTEEQVQAVRKRAQAPVRKPTGRNPEIKKDALVNAITSSIAKNVTGPGNLRTAQASGRISGGFSGRQDDLPSYISRAAGTATAQSDAVLRTDPVRTQAPNTAANPAGRSAQKDFSLLELLGGTVVKGADEAVSRATSTAAWLERNTIGRLFPGAADDTPIQALNEHFQNVKQENQEAFAPNVEAGGRLAQVVDKYGTSVVSAIPSAALAVMTAGTAPAGLEAAASAASRSPGILSALQASAQNMTKNPQFWNSFFQVAGSSYDEALSLGMSEDEADLYALANGLLSSGVEIGGGLETLPSNLKDSSGALRAWIRGMMEEGREEVVQGAISRGLQNMIGSVGNPLVSATDERAVFNPRTAAEEFTGGAVVGGFLGGGQVLAGRLLNGPTAAQEGAGDSGGAGAPGAQNGAQGVLGQNKPPPEGGMVNENGLHAFSEQERINLSSGKKNKVISTFSEAVSFVKNALSNRQNVDRAYLGKVPDSVARTIRQNTGLDIRGFGVMMNGNDIRHMIKNHGDILTEQARGQVAVTADDIARIPEILAAPDRVYLSDETDTKGRKTLIFEKQIGDQYISIQGVSDGKRVLQTDTLYIRKGRPRTTRDTMPGTESAVPVINAQGEPSQKPSSIDVTIPQDAEYVNSVDPLLRWMLGSRPTAAQEGAGAAAGQKMGTDAAQVRGGSEGVQDAWRDTIVNEVRRNSGIGENESPASTSDGTSALSGDLETVVDAWDMAAIPGTVGTVTDGRASQVAPISTVQETGINVNHQEGQNRIRNTGETVRVVETLRDHIPKLSEAEPVSEVSSNSIPFVSGKTMAEKAKTLFEAIKGIVSRPGFGDIEINTRSVKDDLHHGIGTAKAAVIPAIPDIIRTGTQIDFQENWKGRPYDGYIFAAPVTMDGKTVYVAAVVKRTSKNRFYLHEVVDSDGNIIKIDAGDSANQTSLATNGSAGTQSQASVEGTRPLNPDSIIAPGAENVNSDTLAHILFGRPQQQSGETYDNLGSAREGFTTPGMEGKEQTSRLAESMPYNQYQEAATGLSRDDYAKLFRYMSQTEGQSIARAEELVYFIRDGHRTFLRDIDEAAFHELVQSLDDATAWNAPQMDAARMIQQELQGKSANMEIPAEEYTNFLQIMREHETSTGQGVQANAKWSRRNNQNGQTSELEAWENLQNSNLSDEGRQRLFQRIVQWDTQIEQAQTPQQLKDIILEVSRQRGVLNNSLTNRESRILTAAAGSSLDALSFDQLKQFAYAATSALSTDSTPVNWGQRIKTIQVLNMLSSPVTPARNLVGNTSFYGIDALAMRGASILDMALSHVTGTRSVASGGTSLNAAVQAMRMAIAEITMDVDMSGTESRYGTSSNRTFRAGGRLPERVLSMLERNQAYLLNATDEFYKGLASGTARRTQALVDSGKIRTDNPGYAQEQAQNLARYRTFQDNSALSIAIQDIHDVLNMIAGVGDSGRSVRGKTVHSFGLGDIVAPFTRVAGNLASRGLEYSPVNAVRGTVEIARNVAQAVQKKTVDPAAQARAVSDTARGLTGTAIAYGFMLLARAGLLRQADDENDPDVAALNSSEGITGTQLNLSAAERWIHDGSPVWQDGDTLIDLSSVQPLNLLMNLGTEMAKDYQNPIVTAFNATSEAFMDSTAELPVMQFLGNAATDIIRYGEDPREVLLQEGANTVASSVIPNILRTTARGLDDRPRNTYTGDTLLENVRDTVQNSIPVLREELPGSVNPMGDEKTYQIENDTARLLNTLLNPIGVNTYTQSAVSREMETLRGRTGDTSFYLSKSAPSKVSYTDSNGKQHSKSLTYEERQDYLRERGAVALTTFSSMMGSRAYRGASDEEKATLLNLCGDYASQRAKKAILGDDSVPAWVGHAENAQRELGVSPAEYLALYRQYGSEIMSGKAYEKTIQAVQAGLTVGQYASMKAGLDSDGNNSVSQTEAQAYLDRQDFTREQKADLWTIINKSWKRNPYT